jgi:uncharacterized protein YjeT (DUF2065 family)
LYKIINIPFIKKMENIMWETIIKLALVLIIVLSGLGLWLLPRTRLAKRFEMTEKLFTATQIIGMICGATGLAVMFIWTRAAMDNYLWELILMPYFVMMVFWGIIRRTQKSREIIDEKQGLDMAQAMAITFGFSTIVMGFVLFPLYSADLLRGAMWYPVYLFLSILFFSVFTLINFRKN